MQSQNCVAAEASEAFKRENRLLDLNVVAPNAEDETDRHLSFSFAKTVITIVTMLTVLNSEETGKFVGNILKSVLDRPCDTSESQGTKEKSIPWLHAWTGTIAKKLTGADS